MKKGPVTSQIVGAFRLWERAAFLSGLLTRFKGKSIQPHTLLMMTLRSGGRERLTSVSGAHLQKQNQALLPGTEGVAQYGGVHANDCFFFNMPSSFEF